MIVYLAGASSRPRTNRRYGSDPLILKRLETSKGPGQDQDAAMNEATDAQGTIGRVQALYRYPVKGMSPEPLDRVGLAAGECFPADRKYAIENGPGRFDPLAPRYLPKINFLMLMRNERLATLDTKFDAETETLVIARDGAEVARGQLSTPLGRKMIEQFLSSYFSRELRGPPRIVSAAGHSFCDVPLKCVHIVNLESLRDLERVSGRTLAPLRFRANIYVEGPPAWSEFGWIGRRFGIAGVRLKVVDRTERCDATNVDPATAARDADVPALLRRHFSHADFGVYATIETDGEIAVGNDLRSVDD